MGGQPAGEAEEAGAGASGGGDVVDAVPTLPDPEPEEAGEEERVPRVGEGSGAVSGDVASSSAAALADVMETASVGSAAGSLQTRTASTVTDGVSEDGSMDSRGTLATDLSEDTAARLTVSPGCTSGEESALRGLHDSDFADREDEA